MARTSDARERLIETTRALMAAGGYSAVGVAAICDAAGVQKGSFYHFFRSKQALALAAIESHWAMIRPAWTAHLSSAERPLDRIRHHLDGIFHRHVDAHARLGVVRGCFLGNVALERAHLDPILGEGLRAIFDQQVALLLPSLEAAAQRGQLRAGLAPVAGARAVIAHTEGMVMLAKLYNDPELLRPLGPTVLDLLRRPSAA